MLPNKILASSDKAHQPSLAVETERNRIERYEHPRIANANQTKSVLPIAPMTSLTHLPRKKFSDFRSQHEWA